MFCSRVYFDIDYVSIVMDSSFFNKFNAVVVTNTITVKDSGMSISANDVNMITTANIGIGIMGVEGLQAARASDLCRRRSR